MCPFLHRCPPAARYARPGTSPVAQPFLAVPVTTSRDCFQSWQMRGSMSQRSIADPVTSERCKLHEGAELVHAATKRTHSLSKMLLARIAVSPVVLSWGSTKLSLCKPVELWDFFVSPFLRLNALPTFPQRSARFPMEHYLNQLERDRRLIRRHEIRTPLRIRVCKSNSPEHKAESLNLSEYGVYFATNSPRHE